MVNFSNDADVLKYEPALFGELHLPGQILTEGTDGTLSGTTFTADGADFVSAQVSAGGVIYLRSADGVLDGVYEIVSVNSATQITISVIRADSDDQAVSPPAATDISYRVSTFKPQAGEAGFQLTEYFGIKPGNPASDIDAEDEAQFDFVVDAVAAGETLGAVGTATADQTTVISDASADNNKLHITEYDCIEKEEIDVDDLVTIKIAVDESASALTASGTLDVLYCEIEYESTE